jgi:dihydroorotate dehydrogenase
MTGRWGPGHMLEHRVRVQSTKGFMGVPDIQDVYVKMPAGATAKQINTAAIEKAVRQGYGPIKKIVRSEISGGV